MAGPSKGTEAARKAAQTHFTQSEQRDKVIKQEIEKERAASAAKTAQVEGAAAGQGSGRKGRGGEAQGGSPQDGRAGTEAQADYAFLRPARRRVSRNGRGHIGHASVPALAMKRAPQLAYTGRASNWGSPVRPRFSPFRCLRSWAAPHSRKRDSTIQPAAMPSAIAAPRDVAYPGTMRLHVDATDTERHIFRVRQTIPVAGRGTDDAALPALASRHARAHGAHRAARRPHHPRGRDAARLDARCVDGFAFHVTVPNATPALEIEFQILTAVDSAQGRIVMTDEMLNLQWNAVALYPAGYFASRIPVEASVRLPEGWQFGVALETASTHGRRHHVQDRAVRSARRLADVRRALLQAVRARPHRELRRCFSMSSPTARSCSRPSPSISRRTARSSIRRTNCSAAITTTATISCWR